MYPSKINNRIKQSILGQKRPKKGRFFLTKKGVRDMAILKGECDQKWSKNGQRDIKRDMAILKEENENKGPFFQKQNPF